MHSWDWISSDMARPYSMTQQHLVIWERFKSQGWWPLSQRGSQKSRLRSVLDCVIACTLAHWTKRPYSPAERESERECLSSFPHAKPDCFLYCSVILSIVLLIYFCLFVCLYIFVTLSIVLPDCLFTALSIYLIYSGAKKYLVSHQLCKFSHLKRWERPVIFIIGIPQLWETK